MADEGKSLDELIEEAEALLEPEKPRKKRRGESDFQFHRDSLTGHRTTKRKYRPRCTSSSFEGQILKYHPPNSGESLMFFRYFNYRM